jgi:hypothetical protein
MGLPLINVRPFDVDFVEAGSAGPVVVLTHSSVSGARQWRRLMEDLKDRFSASPEPLARPAVSQISFWSR